MRTYLYLLAGTISALIGWNIGQIFLTDFQILKDMPEIVLFPCIAISLAIGMVMNEIFISNPTRLKLCWRKLKIPLVISFVLGLLAGLLSGGIYQILSFEDFSVSAERLRPLGWLIIGASVGLAEGLTWRWQTEEAGDKKRFRQRLQTSVLGAIVASLIAAFMFEFMRDYISQNSALRRAEDPLGFAILGLFLGFAFCVTNSPSYLAALRAGKGFEYILEDPRVTRNLNAPELSYPRIDRSVLKIVSDDEFDEIEEGLSIQLPGTGKIIIGSDKNPNAHISIPGLPMHVAHIELKGREAVLRPNAREYERIQVNGERLVSRRPVRLKHNYILTFLANPQNKDYEEKIYRFVYYNRFLDPQA